MKPLSGQTVVLTRSDGGNREWQKPIEALGAEVYSLPTISLNPIKLNQAIKNTFESINSFDWLIFTSANGVRFAALLFEEMSLHFEQLEVPVAVIGTSTAQAAKDHGLDVAFQPTIPESSALAAELEPVRGKKILLLRSSIAPDDLEQKLLARAGEVIDLPVYSTEVIVEPDPGFAAAVGSKQSLCIVFASPSAVEGFFERITGSTFKLAQDLPYIALGPSVRDALREKGFQNVRLAGDSSIKGVISCLESIS